MKNWLKNLMDSLFIVAVFSFTTMVVNALADKTMEQIGIYGLLLIATSIYKGRQ